MTKKPVTLCTGQWADMPIIELAKKASAWGFEGLELACAGDHFNIERCLSEDSYVREQKDILEKYGLKCLAISNHLVGQCICDAPIDERHKRILPKEIWGNGDPEEVRSRSAENMCNAARAAKLFGAEIVTGFTGSSIWGRIYFFPPVTLEEIEQGYIDFSKRFLPILDVFKNEEIKFALEVHPTEIAYDIYTFRKALESIKDHPCFGINFDPSHLVHQFVDPVQFIEELGARIFHVHIKDTKLNINGKNSILCSHLNFGDSRRGWNFVSPGRGEINWDLVIRALNKVNYSGPLSIEWEDSAMDREWGVKDAISMLKKNLFEPSRIAFDSAFERHGD